MLFKFRKLTTARKQQQQQQQPDQVAVTSDNNKENSNNKAPTSIVGRLTRSLSLMRRSKSQDKRDASSKNNRCDTNDDGDNISNCSSIELVRQLHGGRQSRASSILLGQILLSDNQAASTDNDKVSIIL